MSKEHDKGKYHMYPNGSYGLLLQSLIAFYLGIPNGRYVVEVDEESQMIRFHWSNKKEGAIT